MKLEASEPDVFIGIHTQWFDGILRCWAKSVDCWSACKYGRVDDSTLKPWVSWNPRQQKLAAVRGQLARCYYFATCRSAFHSSLAETFGCLIWQASYPRTFVFDLALRWAKSWEAKPLPDGTYPFQLLVTDIVAARIQFDIAESLL